MAYSPFDQSLDQLGAEDLATLRGVHEGWYVEYKADAITARNLAKSISSFANQYGGWLFLGVAEDPQDLTADGFPGMTSDQTSTCVEALRNASKDLLITPVFYDHRVISGPAESIDLPPDRHIVAVHIPQGPDTPYVHNDGRIYRRIGDSSQPVPVTDRSTFDLLAQRGADARAGLADRVSWSPVTSKGEDEQCYLHLSIFSDPYEMLGHWYDRDFSDFSESMRTESIPFDNFYSSSDGFVARQTVGNDAYRRTFTWHFSRRCHSFITVPIRILGTYSTGRSAWEQYSIGPDFISAVIDKGLDAARILDLNIVFDLFRTAITRHQILAGQADIAGPFYVKARLENVWRTIPFIDHAAYGEHIRSMGLPLVQDVDITAPEGTSLDSFIVVPSTRVDPTEEEDRQGIQSAVLLTLQVIQALGVPPTVLARSIDELLALGARHKAFQEYVRNQS